MRLMAMTVAVVAALCVPASADAMTLNTMVKRAHGNPFRCNHGAKAWTVRENQCAAKVVFRHERWMIPQVFRIVRCESGWDERERTLTEAYHRHGVKIVFTARHVMGLRVAAFLTAGIVRVPFPRFLAADTAASLLGVPTSFGVAYFFTDRLHEIMADVHHAQRWALLAAFVAAAVFITVHAWRRGARLEREAQAARDAGGGP